MVVPAWRLDSSGFPLLVASVENGDGRTPPAMDSVIRLLDQLQYLRGPRVVVVDLTFALPDAARRRLFIDWTKTHWASIRGELLGVACVAPGTFQRTMISAVLWFIQPACPVEAFERRDQAMTWALDVLESNGLSALGRAPVAPQASP